MKVVAWTLGALGSLLLGVAKVTEAVPVGWEEVAAPLCAAVALIVLTRKGGAT